MDNKMLFKVRTQIDKKDYRSFLYLTTFKKSSFTIPLMILITLLGAVIVSLIIKPFTIISFLGFIILMAAVSFGTLCLNIEYRNFSVTRNDSSGIFRNNQELTFYDNYLVISKKGVKAKTAVEYDKLYGAVDSKNYLIIYYSNGVASLIRKTDINAETENLLVSLLNDKLKKKFKA